MDTKLTDDAMEEGGKDISDKEEMDDELLDLLKDDKYFDKVCSRISKEIGEKSLYEALELGCEGLSWAVYQVNK